MSFDLAVAAHLFIGCIAVALYWGALLRPKGSAAHRLAGKAFFILLMGVALSVGFVLFLRPGAFDPAYVVQFAYLTVCLVVVSLLGWTSIRWKSRPEQFRGRHFKILGPIVLVLGAVVLTAGLRQGDPLPVVLSWVGLAYGAAMIRFAWMTAPLHPSWWLNWHLNATCGLFTAVHGNLLFVLWRWAFEPDASRLTSASFHLLVLAVAVVMRLGYGHQRKVPLRFSLQPAIQRAPPPAGELAPDRAHRTP
jgi:uncharacterized membrane protein